MVSERSIRAFLQSYRWVIAGLAGTVVSTYKDINLGPLDLTAWVVAAILLGGILTFGFIIEYAILALDPDFEEEEDRRNRKEPRISR